MAANPLKAPPAGPGRDAAERPGGELRIRPRRHPWRWAGVAVIVLFAAMLAHSFVGDQAFAWGIVGQYLTAGPILNGLLTTIELTFLTMAIGIAGGIVVAAMRLSANPVLSRVAWFYVWLLRSVPLLVQLLFWYNLAALYPRLSFGVPFGPAMASAGTNTMIGPFTAAVLALGLHEVAYMAEIFRGGILSVPRGQTEAALSLGMTPRTALARIVLPQAVRVAVPPTGSEVINVVKGSSLVSVITLTDLLYSVQKIYAENYRVIPLLLVAVIWYLVVTSVLSVGQYFLERRLGRSLSRNARPGGRPGRGWPCWRPWRQRVPSGEPS
ncbi:MAG TPA: amino acid ABC transporter permease [Streptosporangiaceae bacterium]|nr:amino acid ABC transporter permease [Streptosporangiaceae bacterium]